MVDKRAIGLVIFVGSLPGLGGIYDDSPSPDNWEVAEPQVTIENFNKVLVCFLE